MDNITIDTFLNSPPIALRQRIYDGGPPDERTVWSSPPPADVALYDIIKTCDVLIRQAENLLKRAMHHTVPKARAVELESEANGIIYAVRVLIDQFGLTGIEIPAEFVPPELMM